MEHRYDRLVPTKELCWCGRVTLALAVYDGLLAIYCTPVHFLCAES